MADLGWTLTLALGLFVGTGQTCTNLADRPCCRDKPPVDFGDNTNTSPLTYGSCVFNDTMCFYTQGCVDDSMLNWTAHDGYVYTYQHTSEFAEDRSVLVSPPLRFEMESCFQIQYRIHFVATVDGFIEYDNQGVIRLFPPLSQSTGEVSKNVLKTVLHHPSSIGRVKIRARGGGIDGRYVRLSRVSLEEGQCEGQDCNFNDDFCNWTAHHWSRTDEQGKGDENGEFAYVDSNTTEANLTTGFSRAPRAGIHCLKFQYRLKGNATSLKVTIELSSGFQATVWEVTEGCPPGQWQDGVIPVPAPTAYRITFSGHRGNQGSNTVALDNVVVDEDEQKCMYTPPDSGTGVTFPPIPPTPSVTTPGSNSRNSGDSNGAVIGGVVAAVVVVAVVVVIVIIWWRRRSVESGNRETKMIRSVEQAHNSPKGIDNPAHNTTDNQTGEYSEIPSSHFLPSVPPTESDYTDIDGVTSERSDVNPYNEAENGAPANSGYSADDYNHLDHRGAGAMTAAMKKKEERTEGGSGQPKKDPYSLAKPVVAHDYTKLQDDKKTPAKTTTVTQPGLKPTAASKPGQQDGDYNIITHDRNQPLRGVDTPSNPYNLPGPDTTAKPSVAAVSAGRAEAEGDYNTLSHDGASPRKGNQAATNPSNATGPYSVAKPIHEGQNPRSAVEGREATAGNYFLLEPNSTTGEGVSASKGRDATSSDYFLLEPDLTSIDAPGSGGQPAAGEPGPDPNDYNSLSFDEARKQSARAGSTTRNAYDHVRNDQGDDYSVAQMGKRNVVIDSDYDRIKH